MNLLKSFSLDKSGIIFPNVPKNSAALPGFTSLTTNLRTIYLD